MDVSLGKLDHYWTVTRFISKILNPIWKQSFGIEIKSLRTNIAKIELFDHDLKKKDLNLKSYYLIFQIDY